MNYTKGNVNYLCSVVALKTFEPIKNADRIQVAKIYSNDVIVSKEAKVGDIFLYFPVEVAISDSFLANNNLYKKHEFGNKFPDNPPGFFETSGRVKAVKLKGVKSCGFAIPIESLSYTGVDLSQFTPGLDFDGFDDGSGLVEICKKYVPKRIKATGVGNPGKKGFEINYEDRIVNEAFRKHFDTANLRRNSHVIKPETTISISTKLHGTSGRFANLLIKKELPWYLRLLDLIGIPIEKTTYGTIWGSRTVTKGIGSKPKVDSKHYYSEDVWASVKDKFVEGKLPAGYTIYGEIVGYTPSGGAIQSCKEGPYSYGCAPGESALYVYRVTNTNAEGMVLELNRDQRIAFCERYGFIPVPELYYGEAWNFVDQKLMGGYDESVADYLKQNKLEFGEAFVKICEETYVRDEPCKLCKTGVWAEGVVVSIDKFDRIDSYKLKSWAFLHGVETPQNDANSIDIETAESENVVE